MKEKAKNREYEILKRIIVDIMSERKNEKQRDLEADSLANLMQIAEENKLTAQNETNNGTALPGQANGILQQ